MQPRVKCLPIQAENSSLFLFLPSNRSAIKLGWLHAKTLLIPASVALPTKRIIELFLEKCEAFWLASKRYYQKKTLGNVCSR
jgi:hypothetical protein